MPSNDKKNPDSVNIPPFETEDLRKNLAEFLDADFFDPVTKRTVKVGNFKWGVYAFFDYDGEPIYIGQTNELLRTRIRRHLTNQRTDAVAMSVLDPFEVYEIEVWPLPQFQKKTSKEDKAAAKAYLDALESLIYQKALKESEFSAVLNEKDPPASSLKVKPPPSLRRRIVSDEVYELRSHPDYRIARRALRLVAGLRKVWVAAAKAQGLHAGRAGFQAQAGHRAAEYMAKWDLSDEVAVGAVKESKDKDKGKTPSQLLRRGYEGDKAASRLWGEYERAMRGKSVLRFSPGLRKMAGVPDMTDKKAAEENGEGERPEETPREVLPLIDILPCDLWAEAKRYGLDRDDLKRAAKQDGRAGIRAYLADLREAAAFHPLE